LTVCKAAVDLARDGNVAAVDRAGEVPCGQPVSGQHLPGLVTIVIDRLLAQDTSPAFGIDDAFEILATRGST
jgi:hypothetical protein